MSSIVIFSLLSLLLLSFILWLLVRWIMKVSKQMSWNHRINKWIVLIYFGVLLLSAIVYEFLPENGEKVVTEDELQLLIEENEAFETALRNEEVSKLDSKFLVEEWTKELEGNKLALISSNSEQFGVRPMVYVEWIDSKDQYVEGKVYQTNITMKGINMNGKVPIMNVDLEDDRLVIGEQMEQELKFYRFSNELAIAEINSSDYEKDARGYTYIYLKVPKHIELVDEMGLQLY